MRGTGESWICAGRLVQDDEGADDEMVRKLETEAAGRRGGGSGDVVTSQAAELVDGRTVAGGETPGLIGDGVLEQISYPAAVAETRTVRLGLEELSYSDTGIVVERVAVVAGHPFEDDHQLVVR